MDKIIKESLIKLQHDYGIRILFAVENGSRVWRMDSKDSDYDVRFVYYYEPHEYTTINPKATVINRMCNKHGVIVSEKPTLDFSGFDILKFGKMLSASNPACIEWLQSDIIYFGDKPTAMYKFATENYNPMTLYHHYKSMCRQNYLKYIKTHEGTSYKKYLYTMRGLINAKFISETQSLPDINFSKVVNSEAIKKSVPKEIIDSLNAIIALKKESKEKECVENIKNMDEYIEAFINDMTADISNRKSINTPIDEEITTIIFRDLDDEWWRR